MWPLLGTAHSALWPQPRLCFWLWVGAYTEFSPESSALKFFSLEIAPSPPTWRSCILERLALRGQHVVGPHPDCVTFPSVGLSFHIRT